MLYYYIASYINYIAIDRIHFMYKTCSYSYTFITKLDRFNSWMEKQAEGLYN